jgi:hypothetical protein
MFSKKLEPVGTLARRIDHGAARTTGGSRRKLSAERLRRPGGFGEQAPSSL